MSGTGKTETDVSAGNTNVYMSTDHNPEGNNSVDNNPGSDNSGNDNPGGNNTGSDNSGNDNPGGNNTARNNTSLHISTLIQQLILKTAPR
ncbi:hypothetical protein ACGTI2_13620 [Morganella morganii]|uniref:hypothetical protein n=1 Tax=Morganella morganii TaxID=582 RepID=UPI00386732DC